MFKDWYKRADTNIAGISPWQTVELKRMLKNAYEAGRKQGRHEATIVAEKAIELRELLRSKQP